jgi:hypothetical protein
LILALIMAAFPALPLGRGRQIAKIDDYCRSVDAALSTATPFLFVGPDPWEEADSESEDDSDPAAAYVYTLGPQIRRVYLRITDASEGWQQEITYCFNPDGELVRRVRILDSPKSNISLETLTYYANGELIKESAHRHALTHGHQDSSEFTDPGAPVFWTTDDLPFSDDIDLWRGLI